MYVGTIIIRETERLYSNVTFNEGLGNKGTIAFNEQFPANKLLSVSSLQNNIRFSHSRHKQTTLKLARGSCRIIRIDCHGMRVHSLTRRHDRLTERRVFTVQCSRGRKQSRCATIHWNNHRNIKSGYSFCSRKSKQALAFNNMHALHFDFVTIKSNHWYPHKLCYTLDL